MNVAARMRQDWNERAKENAKHYVQSETSQWDDREFFRSGEISVANEVMPDMLSICGGSRSPRDLRMLEIGCGVGRMTRMLATIFGRVAAVDVSDEMLAQAKLNLSAAENVDFYLGDGDNLQFLEASSVDFAFSFIVFQHIPTYQVIENYCREVYRVLKPGSLFKFQVQGSGLIPRDQTDTWVGYPITEADAPELAQSTGFTLERTAGANTQYFWLWFRKP